MHWLRVSDGFEVIVEARRQRVPRAHGQFFQTPHQRRAHEGKNSINKVSYPARARTKVFRRRTRKALVWRLATRRFPPPPFFYKCCRCGRDSRQTRRIHAGGGEDLWGFYRVVYRPDLVVATPEEWK